MIAQLKMELSTQSGQILHYNHTSLLHGVIMQTITTQYAQVLHTLDVLPYAQSLEIENGNAFWVVTTLTEQARIEILDLLRADAFSHFTLTHHQMPVTIVSKTYSELSYPQLLDRFYVQEQNERYLRLQFTTCTSFKSQGQYCIFPDMRLILQSLLQKFNANCPCYTLQEDHLLEDLTAACEIIGYTLHSNKFSLERTKIPAFLGEVLVKIDGNSTMLSLINMLLHFGAYSGVGVKTALGMGHVHILTKNQSS